MIFSTVLSISNSMSSFVPKYWLNWQILVAIFNEFCGQGWDHLNVHTCPLLDDPTGVKAPRGPGVRFLQNAFKIPDRNKVFLQEPNITLRKQARSWLLVELGKVKSTVFCSTSVLTVISCKQILESAL